MKTIWFYIKEIFLPLVYTGLASLIALGILGIENERLVWLKVVLLILNIALLLFIVATNFFKEGEKALKVRIANDFEREHIVLTGENRALQINEEYKPWKGFLIGFISCAPLVILMLVHTVLLIAGVESKAGAIASFIYLLVFGFNCLDLSALSSTTITVTQPYITLIFIPIMVLAVGFSYMLGARKVELQQQRIKKIHREIYGE